MSFGYLRPSSQTLFLSQKLDVSPIRPSVHVAAGNGCKTVISSHGAACWDWDLDRPSERSSPRHSIHSFFTPYLPSTHTLLI